MGRAAGETSGRKRIGTTLEVSFGFQNGQVGRAKSGNGKLVLNRHTLMLY